MADTPVLGAPAGISLHQNGRFSVDFAWAKAPDQMWLRALGDLMMRSGRDSVEADVERLTMTFDPQDAELALDDLVVLLEDADRSYRHDLEQRDAAVRYVQEALQSRYGTGVDLPVREV